MHLGLTESDVKNRSDFEIGIRIQFIFFNIAKWGLNTCMTSAMYYVVGYITLFKQFFFIKPSKFNHNNS